MPKLGLYNAGPYDTWQNRMCTRRNKNKTGEALKSLVFAFVPGGVGAMVKYAVKAGKLSENA